MKKIRWRVLGAFGVVTLGAVFLQQIFTSLLFERSHEHLSFDVSVSLPVLVLALVVALVRLFLFLAPVNTFLRDPSRVGFEDRLALKNRLGRLPRVLFIGNLGLFFVAPILILGLKLASGDTLPSTLDLVLILALNGAFGFMAWLQEINWIEALTLGARRGLQLHEVTGTTRDISLRRRLFWVNLGSVLLSGLLAGMAALGFYREVVAYYTELGADALTAASVVSDQAVSDNEVRVVVQLGMLFLAVLAWTVGLTTTALATVSRQLKALETKVGEMAEGVTDLSVRAEVLFFDEVGLLTGRINQMMDRWQTIVGAIQATAGKVSASTSLVTAGSHQAEGRLGEVANARAQADAALSGQGHALEATLSVAQDLANSSVSVKAVAVDQGEAVARGAEAMEALAASVASVRELTIRADGLAGSLRQTSEQGGKSVEAVRQAMEAIQEAAQAVSGTVATIKKTASQTNLLAMNAAIEAAHAGSMGLGFAVVASEVRTLAADSSRGAKTITDLMRVMDSKIAEGDRLAREAGEAFVRIYDLIIQTSEVMGTVSRAMEEQSQGTETLLLSTKTLKEAASHIESVTDKQATHAEDLHQSVQILVETGASLAMAQEVQGRVMTELTELVRTVAREAEQNSQAAQSLDQTVVGFKGIDTPAKPS